MVRSVTACACTEKAAALTAGDLEIKRALARMTRVCFSGGYLPVCHELSKLFTSWLVTKAESLNLIVKCMLPSAVNSVKHRNSSKTQQDAQLCFYMEALNMCRTWCLLLSRPIARSRPRIMRLHGQDSEFMLALQDMN